jgi:2'-5' RNA ligase
MATQIPLPGFEPPAQGRDRLFFGLFPEPRAAGKIAQVTRRVRAERRLSGQPLAAERFHVTLQGLGVHGGVPRPLVAAASRAAATVELDSFFVRLDRLLSFTGRSRALAMRAVVLRSGDEIAALNALRQALANGLAAVGLSRPATSRFTPHVTLLYDAQSIAERPIERVGWTVREFALVYSRPQRPYEILGRWPLR